MKAERMREGRVAECGPGIVLPFHCPTSLPSLPSVPASLRENLLPWLWGLFRDKGLQFGPETADNQILPVLTDRFKGGRQSLRPKR